MSILILTADQHGLYNPNDRTSDITDSLHDLLDAGEHGPETPINVIVTSGSLAAKDWGVHYPTTGITILFHWSKGIISLGQKYRKHVKLMGRALTHLYEVLSAMAPRRQILLTADRGGASVALASLPQAPINRISKLFLFHAREFSAYALSAAKSKAGRDMRIYNFTNAAKPIRTRMAERLSARPGKRDHFVNQGMAFKLPNWTDIAQSPKDFTTWLEDLGFGQPLAGFGPAPIQKPVSIPATTLVDDRNVA